MKKTTPLLLLVDDNPENLDLLVTYLENSGMNLSVTLNGEDAITLAHSQQPDVILLDIMMPGIDGFETCKRLKADVITHGIPVLFMSALTDTVDKLRGFEVGGVDYLTKPLQQAEVLARVNAHLTIRQQQLALEAKNHELAALNATLQAEIERRNAAEQAFAQADAKLSALSAQEARRWGIDAFIGQSPQILQVLDAVRRLQATDKTNVLVLGESGTGKELIARAIHFGSARSGQPFIAVNCSAIPADLADAEFFGHVKGAFTGATTNRQGYFEQADGGTLFLDEIGDMPLPLQAKLLRVLENQRLTPVGSNRERHVNVRVVAATNVDMEQRIAAKSFRADLYFRLAGYVLQLPPLRARKADIPLLVSHFLKLFSEQMGRLQEISQDAMQALQDYEYPGNIRELKNLIEYALISSHGQPIRVFHLHFMSVPLLPSTTPAIPMAPIPTGQVPKPIANREDETAKILAYLHQHQQINNTQCQALLGVSHHRASYLLKNLHKDGVISKSGERRWAIYVLREQDI